MERKEILETLKKFGLSDYESKTYTALVLKGPSKAGDICREADVPQSKIYETLEYLMSKQLVEVFEGRPKEFKAVPPDIVLKGLVERRETDLKALKGMASSIIGILKPVEQENMIEGIWTQKGEKSKEVLDRLSGMLEKCQSYAYDITRDFSYSSRYRETIKSCLKRKVKIMTICIGGINENNYLNAKWYDSHNLPIKSFETNIHPRILVIDGKEVSIRLDNNPLKSRFTFQSIWSQDPSLVKVFDNYMKSLWNSSRPIDFKKIPVPKMDAALNS
ncbi:MAG TPA: helix-turn-helix domain-containing protein [archaeon]|nr:helix-turn-helix domain-containing protein [archaeon]